MSIWTSIFGSETLVVTPPTRGEDAHGGLVKRYDSANSYKVQADVQAAPSDADTSHREGYGWSALAYLDASGRVPAPGDRVEWVGELYRVVSPARIVVGAGLTEDVAVVTLKKQEG